MTEDPFNEGQPAARARRLRSLAIALTLLAFGVLIFFITFARLSANAARG